jgi:putative peptidoglycan lipid II flippase
VDRVFYARHDTRTPVMVAILAVGVNVVLSLVLMRTGLSFRGLALANSLAALVEAGVLVWLVSVHLPGSVSFARLANPALRIVAASLVMGLPVAWLAAQLEPLLRPYGTPGQAAVVGTCIAFGAVLYVLASLAFRSDELMALRRLVRR